MVASVFLFCKGLTAFPTGLSRCTDEKKKGIGEGGKVHGEEERARRSVKQGRGCN